MGTRCIIFFFPAFHDSKSESMVCNFAITPPYKLGKGYSVCIVLLRLDNICCSLFKSVPSAIPQNLILVLQGKPYPAEVLRITPIHTELRRQLFHIF